MKTASIDYKYQNLGSVYRLVEQFELISRTDLAKLSGLAPASMTLLTKNLIDNKFILERTSQNLPSRGRPAVGLAISAFHWRFLCVTIAPTKLTVSLCELSGRPLYQLNYTFSLAEYPTLDEYIFDCLQNFARHYPNDMDNLLAASVSVVGKINSSKTHITQLGSQPINCPVMEKIKLLVDKPIYLNEHFQLWFLAESTLGSLISHDNVIFLQLDDAVNLSVLLKGKLLHQDEHKRMCVDKMIMPRFSELSDEIAQDQNEIARYQLRNQVTFSALIKLIDHYLPNTLSSTDEKISFFCEQVTQKQADALRILEHITDNLAYMLMNLINIFSTERIMLNSPLLAIKNELFEQIQTKLRKNLLLDTLKIDIVTSRYDWDSAYIPAVAIKLAIYEGALLKDVLAI